jgi:polyhydroxyalkanoate synthesis regulator phasin
MDQKQIVKQMIEFNKTAFDNTFNAMAVLQDQTEKLIFHFLEKAPWFPTEGKKAIDEWVSACKKGREEFKKNANESYKKVTDYFAKAKKEEMRKDARK